MEKNKFTAPAEKLAQECKEYGEYKLSTLKLQAAKGLSQGMAAITGYILLFILGSALVLVLSMGLILFLGELLESYALAAFIVAGVLLVVFLILLAAKKQLFRDTFIPTFVSVFTDSEDKAVLDAAAKIKTKDELDAAIMKSQVQEYKQEAHIVRQMSRVKDFYTPEHLAKMLLGSEIIPGIIKRIFGNSK